MFGLTTTCYHVVCTSVKYFCPPVFRVVWSRQDDPPRVLQDSAGSRGARGPVLPGRQAPCSAPLWGEGLQTSLARPGLGQGEDDGFSYIGLYQSDAKLDK